MANVILGLLVFSQPANVSVLRCAGLSVLAIFWSGSRTCKQSYELYCYCLNIKVTLTAQTGNPGEKICSDSGPLDRTVNSVKAV